MGKREIQTAIEFFGDGFEQTKKKFPEYKTALAALKTMEWMEDTYKDGDISDTPQIRTIKYCLDKFNSFKDGR